ncbi:aldehyde dehydrogenase family protein [Sandaracinus amylolyticus]|uniref:Aldehyde dehydrogenase n=1 Tax=Sandaracinus amylolyticus TaxID=927083 RepID=A0A0F6WAJ4_9BACT|nr:aldehyde dehydrogenase family protein [Sandaracinus amylolyticus]AKF11611.1 Aldehyde dehydrogenase [Sandaracinus amylolyticus]
MHEARSASVPGVTPSAPVVRDGAIHPVCPVDLRPLAPIPVASAADVTKAVEEARRAQHGWASRPVSERADALRRAAKAMLADRLEVVALMRDEVGKLEVDALMSEVLGPLDQVNSWASVIEPAIARKKVGLNPINFPKKKAWIDRVPRGVIGIVAPWNYPVATLFRTVIPALLCGNGVVLKPSEYATRVAQWFCGKLAAELPPGLLTVVPGGRETGIALIESGIDACVFTGSVAAGRDVSRRCGERMIPCSIELGGKDAAIVLADCDLDRTVAGITHWALHNVGQACGAIEIAYVDARIADQLVSRLARAWQSLKVGPGAPGEVDVSPLTNAKQLALVEAHVEDAIAKGAKVVCGGRRLGEGLFYLPTLLDHCTDAMDVVADETFGPVLAVVRVDGAAEAIRRVNAGRYGLTSSIWTSDHARALRLAEQIEVGVVTINNHAMTGAIAALPWSGTRDTGTGIANSELALGTFTRPKTILLDSNEAPELFWMPYDKTLWELGNLLSEAQIPKIGPALVKIPFLIKQRVDTVRRFFRS